MLLTVNQQIDICKRLERIFSAYGIGSSTALFPIRLSNVMLAGWDEKYAMGSKQNKACVMVLVFANAAG